MPPRKRAAAEVIKEEVAAVSPARKRRTKQDKSEIDPIAEVPSNASASSSTKRDVTPRKAAKTGHSNGGVEEIKEEEHTVKSPSKKGKAKGKTEGVDIQLDPKVEEEVERLADAAVASLKKERNRKVKEDDDTPRHPSAPPIGGSKMDTLADSSIPKNMTIDDPLTLENTPKAKEITRIMSWNILSLKSSLSKGFMRYIEAEQADVVILTETKCNDVPMLPALSEIYPHQTWGIGKTKGYAGIALLSKTKPIKTSIGLPDWDVDTKGRIITAEYENYIVIGTYVVNAGENLKTLPQKQAWNEHFAEHLAACDSRKPAIWTGDLNVVLDARDLSNASKKWNKSAGYTEIECEHHRKVLLGTAHEGAKPYVDIWRERHPDAVGHYSYYGFRGMCRSKGIGWRLDSFIIPQRIANQVTACEIRHTIYGASDHLPVYMDIKGSL